MCEAQLTRNFEYANEESVDAELKCSICTDPFLDPVITSPCEHIFCRAGIERVLEIRPVCPLCRQEPIRIEEFKPADRAVSNLLDHLLVHCQLCGHTNIQRSLFAEHIKIECLKAKLMCSAIDLKCPWVGPRDERADHISHCNFELMRPVLSQYIVMEMQFQQTQRENEELRLQVWGLNHRYDQLQRHVGERSPSKLKFREAHYYETIRLSITKDLAFSAFAIDRSSDQCDLVTKWFDTCRRPWRWERLQSAGTSSRIVSG